jgi:hypothetical protein
MSGLLPIRPIENETLPVAGSTSTHEWKGYVAQSEMPRLYNPSNHLIVTANNQIVDDNFGQYVTTDWDYGYRARRITDLLSAASTISVTGSTRRLRARSRVRPSSQRWARTYTGSTAATSRRAASSPFSSIYSTSQARLSSPRRLMT